LLEAQQASGMRISSNLILRASPRFVELKRQIDDGLFGDIFSIEGDYLHSILHKIVDGWRGHMDFYCVTYGGGIHLVDLMRWLLSDEVVEVCGMGNKVLTSSSAYRYPDTIVNLLRFSKGALGKTMTTLGPARSKFHALNVYGTNRTFLNDLPDAKVFLGDQPGDQRVVTTPYPGTEKGDLLPEFIDAIRADREPLVGTIDVFRCLDVCFAAWKSVQACRTIPVQYLI
jgi:predicted dehydrogenase